MVKLFIITLLIFILASCSIGQYSTSMGFVASPELDKLNAVSATQTIYYK